MVKEGDSRPFIMQKSFYLSCSNLGGIEMDDDETILDQFFGLGDWPVMRGASWEGIYFDWVEVAKKSRRLGMKFDWFLDFSIYEDVNDTGLNILKVSWSTTILGKYFLVWQIDIPPDLTPFRPFEVHLRQKLFTKVALILGAPERLAHYETGRTIDFENELRKVSCGCIADQDVSIGFSLPTSTEARRHTGTLCLCRKWQSTKSKSFGPISLGWNWSTT